MLFLYDIGILLYYFFVLLASLTNKKAGAWIKGRKNLLPLIKKQISRKNNYVWFHFASLGEFEQGRPVLEEIKAEYPGYLVVITFFSPSGYEVRKDCKIADHVFYLPLDTRENAREFIKIVKPSLAVFTKYEYWYYFFDELHKNKIPLIIISGIFREDQPFFKWYGNLHREMLRMVSHFFVQNEDSRQLLNNSGLFNVTVSGDTRFDRVIKNAGQISIIPAIEKFSQGSKVFIAGSSWHEDEVLIAGLTTKFSEWKFIIAPHEVNQTHIKSLEKLFPESIKWSDLKIESSNSRVLIIDNIGMLSSLYQYGHIAYIGGGFGAGIHNTLEAAAFGMPVIFGPNFKKFQEARDLIKTGAAFTINNFEELSERMLYLENDVVRGHLSQIAQGYVTRKGGATKVIVQYLKEKVFAKL